MSNIGLQHLTKPDIYLKVNLGKRASVPSLAKGQSPSATSAMSMNSTPSRRHSNPDGSQSEKRNNNSKPLVRAASKTHQRHRSYSSRSERQSSSGGYSSSCSQKRKGCVEPSFVESQLQPLLSPIHVVSRQEFPTHSDVISKLPDSVERLMETIGCSPISSSSGSAELVAQPCSSSSNVPTGVQLSHLPPLDQLSGEKSSTSTQKDPKDVPAVPNKRKSGHGSGDPSTSANIEAKRPKCASKGISSPCYSTISSESDVFEATSPAKVKTEVLGAVLKANDHEIDEIILSDIDSLSEASTILRAEDSQVIQDPPMPPISLERSSPKEDGALARGSGNPKVDSALQVDISNVLLESGTQTEPRVAGRGIQTDQLAIPVKNLAHESSQTDFAPVSAANHSIESVVASTQVNFFIDMAANEPVGEWGKDWEMEGVNLYQQLEKTVMNREELNVELSVLETERGLVTQDRNLDREAWEKLTNELELSSQLEFTIQEAQHDIAVKLVELDAQQFKLCNQRRRAQLEAADADLQLDDPSDWEEQRKALQEQKGSLVSELQKQREKRVAHRLLSVQKAETRKALDQKIDNHLASYVALRNRFLEVQGRKQALSKEIGDIQRRILMLDYHKLRYKSQLIEREPRGTLVFDFTPKAEAAKRAAMINAAKGMPEVPPELVHEFMHTLVSFHSFTLVSMEDPANYQALEPERSKIAQVFDRMKTFFAGNFTEERANYVLYLWQEQLNSNNKCTLCQNVVAFFDYRHVKRTVLEIRRHSKSKKALVDSLTC